MHSDNTSDDYQYTTSLPSGSCSQNNNRDDLDTDRQEERTRKSMERNYTQNSLWNYSQSTIHYTSDVDEDDDQTLWSYPEGYNNNNASERPQHNKNSFRKKYSQSHTKTYHENEDDNEDVKDDQTLWSYAAGYNNASERYMQPRYYLNHGDSFHQAFNAHYSQNKQDDEYGYYNNNTEIKSYNNMDPKKQTHQIPPPPPPPESFDDIDLEECPPEDEKKRKEEYLLTVQKRHKKRALFLILILVSLTCTFLYYGIQFRRTAVARNDDGDNRDTMMMNDNLEDEVPEDMDSSRSSTKTIALALAPMDEVKNVLVNVFNHTNSTD